MNQNKTLGQHAFSYFARLFAIDAGCFVMSGMILAQWDYNPLRCVIQILSFILLLCVTYSYIYKIGFYDSSLVNSGIIVPNRLKGLIIGCIANIPFFITAILLVLARFGVVSSKVYGYYKLINSLFFPFLSTVLPSDMLINEVHTGDFILAVAVQIVIPLLAMLSYLVGLSKFSFREAVFYKKITDGEDNTL